MVAQNLSLVGAAQGLAEFWSRKNAKVHEIGATDQRFRKCLPEPQFLPDFAGSHDGCRIAITGTPRIGLGNVQEQAAVRNA